MASRHDRFICRPNRIDAAPAAGASLPRRVPLALEDQAKLTGMRNSVRAVGAIAGSAALLVLPAWSAAEGSTAAAVAVPAASVTIAAVGDTMLGTTPHLPPD